MPQTIGQSKLHFVVMKPHLSQGKHSLPSFLHQLFNSSSGQPPLHTHAFPLNTSATLVCDKTSPLVRQTSSAVVLVPAPQQQLWPGPGVAAAAQPASAGGASGSAGAGSLQRHLCSLLQHPGCSLPCLLLQPPIPPACRLQPAEYRVGIRSSLSCKGIYVLLSGI